MRPSSQKRLEITALRHHPKKKLFSKAVAGIIGEPVRIKLKRDAILYRAKPYPILLKNREVIEQEVGRQCSIGCLRRLTPEGFEERAFPGFGVPKSNGTICFVIDFCQINPNLVRCEFPLWTTEEILTSIKGFTYSTSIDLNMGYPSIPLNNEAKKS